MAGGMKCGLSGGSEGKGGEVGFRVLGVEVCL